MAYQDMSSNWAYKTPVLAADFNQLGENDKYLDFKNIILKTDIVINISLINARFNNYSIYCNNFTINNGITWTGNLFVHAKEKIKISGNINANSLGSSISQENGFFPFYTNIMGGKGQEEGIVSNPGYGLGAAGGNGSSYAWGKAGGGAGGGSVVLIANVIEIEPTSLITANGGDGGRVPAQFIGGGGAGGLIYFAYSDSYINNGVQTVNGGIGANNGSNGLIITEVI